MPEIRPRGWKVHTDTERRLLAEINRRAVIPEHGFEQTPHGVMPPPPWRAPRPPLSPIFHLDDTSAAMSLTAGVVFCPYAVGEDKIIHTLGSKPYRPQIGGTDIDADPAPQLSLSTGTNIIACTVELKKMEDEVSSDAASNNYGDWTTDTNATPPDAHTHNITIQMDERNYSIKTDGATGTTIPQIEKAATFADFKDTELERHMFMGVIYVESGTPYRINYENSEWYRWGSFDFVFLPHIIDKSTSGHDPQVDVGSPVVTTEDGGAIP